MARAVTRSPFQSYKDTVRQEAALEMVRIRQAEIAALKRLQLHERNAKKQRQLATKLLALSNNLKSWLDYLADDTPVVARATVIPGRKKTNG